MKVSSIRSTIMLFLLCCVVIVSGGFLAGCAGDDGAQGPAGPAGADATVGTVAAGTLTFDDLRNVALGGKILSVSTAGNQPVVTFQVYNKGTMEGIAGLRTFALHIAQLKPEANGSNSYWQNYILTGSSSAGPFRPGADPVSTFNATTGAKTYQGYSVIDNNDGTYVVTFGANIKSGTTTTLSTPAVNGGTSSSFLSKATVTYDANLTHRIVVGVRSVAVPGVVGLTPDAYAGPINPVTGLPFAQFTNTNGVNLAFDFVPATGAVLTTPARDIVTIDRCNQCHYKIQYGSNNTSGHFGSRTDTKTCVMCHTPQNIVSGQTTTTNGDFTPLIHKIHMGEELPLAETQLGINLNEVTYPQDVRNCTMCHKGVLSDNWKTKPTRKACGSCHNDVDFATGANHPAPGGIRTDDTACSGCHSVASIESDHLPVVPPDPNNRYTVTRLTGTTAGSNNNTNAAYVAAAGAVPAGAQVITYDVKSVTTTTVGGVARPTIQFKLRSAASATAAPTDVVFSVASYSTGVGTDELMPNFVGSPSAYFAWAVPQDGITAPADFNATASGYIKNLWNGTAMTNIGSSSSPNFVSTGTITGPDSSGYYSAVLTYATVTSGAKMLTGGVGYQYGLSTSAPGGTTISTQPLTQTNLPAYPFTPAVGGVGQEGGEGGLSVPPPNVWKAATGYTARRTIVETARCNACHVKLGVKPTFHAGQRNDAPTCVFCHNVNRVNSGWAVNIKEAVHAIHAGAKRVNKFSWEATAGAKYWEITYPGRGMLKNCEMCHAAGMYDFSASAYTANNGALVNNMLFSTAATGTISASAKVIVTGDETISSSDTVVSPFVTLGAGYGSGFSYNAGTGATTAASGATSVISPISSACFACHDTAAAKSHMVLNGGSIYEARSTALAKAETCLICHGPAANTAYGDYVPAIKAVHRWW